MTITSAKPFTGPQGRFIRKKNKEKQKEPFKVYGAIIAGMFAGAIIFAGAQAYVTNKQNSGNRCRCASSGPSNSSGASAVPCSAIKCQ
jgi:hypothetical protein